MVKKSKILSIILVIIFAFSIIIIPAEAKVSEVYIGGESFGLKLYCKGVMVLRLERFKSSSGLVCPAEKSGIKVNDIITKTNGERITGNERFSEIIKSSNGKTLNLEVLRNNQTIRLKLKAQKNSRGVYYSGMWIRDSCAGLGTISYYNPDNMTYGALGHGICDIDTGGLMQSDSGEIISANVTSVQKSQNSSIGTLNGYFTNTKIGTISRNTPLGIYGNLTQIPDKAKKYKIADTSELRIGEAIMYSTIRGESPQKYKIEIVEICSNKYSNRNMVVRITDERLLNETGGIVQGMSGSPIVQNGKFAGALTHVFVDDCAVGYAVTAENLVKN